MIKIEKGILNWHKLINENFDKLIKMIQEQRKEIDYLKNLIPDSSEGSDDDMARGMSFVSLSLGDVQSFSSLRYEVIQSNVSLELGDAQKFMSKNIELNHIREVVIIEEDDN